MERVSTLISKLQKQLDEKAPADSMLNTAQMLVAELLGKAENRKEKKQEKVSVLMPYSHVKMAGVHNDNGEENAEEKIVEVLKVDEKEIEQELEQIKKNAAVVNAMVSNARPGFVYDPIEDMPTLAHQTPIEKKQVPKNEIPFEYPESLNDRLKEVKIELSERLTEMPIKDLRKAIGINDRYLFLNELFRGDEAMYERSIKTIQNFSIFAEAEYWIKRELKVKLGWIDSEPAVKQFDSLVKRRFSGV
ncbi:MAG: hypothetical protein M3015_08410 [Bacteroidota bacterium]|nr:hypothetical protein [Bacteroidota bacterium]